MRSEAEKKIGEGTDKPSCRKHKRGPNFSTFLDLEVIFGQ